ncbi:hypothetical protein M0802_011907 [Mischocyttarus mexicanus]|nr:hypothetical protein M0802_011907 [Mischocyttarus mexicanus]
MILDYNLEMKPDSLIFSLWKKPPLDVFHNVYIFNITNPVEFLAGMEKLKLEEVGPYVYQEFLEETNITFNDNGTITYVPKRTVFFVPELSKGDPKKDFVTVPNIPMLGIASALSDAGFFMNYLMTQLNNMIGTKPIINISVYDYLWGYDDNLVKLAAEILPSYLKFRKFGLLDRLYAEGENIVNINIRKNDDMRDENGRYFSIQTYNGSPGLSYWGYREEKENRTYPENTRCNSIRGALEGGVFPPNLDKRAVFRIFRKSFCRTIPIIFKEDIFVEKNIPSYLYTLSEDFLDPPDQNPDNEYIPLVISLPHFLNGDPSLVNDVEGLHPNPEKHGTRVIIQPEIGLLLAFKSRIQLNLMMHYTQHNSKIKPFNNLTIPVFWSDLTTAPLASDLLFLLRLIIVVLPLAQTMIMYLLIITGLTLIALSLVSSIWIFNQHRNERSEFIRRDSADLRIPLKCDQNTTIRILPNIENIKSKSDLCS